MKLYVQLPDKVQNAVGFSKLSKMDMELHIKLLLSIEMISTSEAENN